MKKYISAVLPMLLSLLPFTAKAMYTEIGASYAYKTQTYDQNNNNKLESLTGSLAFYFWDRIAIEVSYTDATAIVESKAFSTDPQRTIEQRSQVLGADMIFTFANKQALFQPYVKGGFAQITRTQQTKIEGQDLYTNAPEQLMTPSYGIGLKIALTDFFGLKFSYDAWSTPLNSNSQTDDSAFKAGITWIL